MMARSVDFPEPFAPVSTEIRPASKRASTPASARTAPKRLVTRRSSTAIETPTIVDSRPGRTPSQPADDSREPAREASERTASPSDRLWSGASGHDVSSHGHEIPSGGSWLASCRSAVDRTGQLVHHEGQDIPTQGRCIEAIGRGVADGGPPVDRSRQEEPWTAWRGRRTRRAVGETMLRSRS